jgi:hypothetical protein
MDSISEPQATIEGREMMRLSRSPIRVQTALLILSLASGGFAAPALASAGPPAVAPAPEGEQGESALRTGLYRGTVTNRKSGKPVVGAVVIFLDEETGEAFQIATNDKGEYEINLPAGEYIVDIQVGRKTYRSSGTFREEADGKRWVMDFTVGSKLTEKDLKIQTTPKDVRLVATEPRPPLEPSRKLAEFLIFIGGVIGVAALSD